MPSCITNKVELTDLVEVLLRQTLSATETSAASGLHRCRVLPGC
jgi:hypothetical protein